MADITLRHVSVHLPIYNAKARALKTSLLRRTVGGDLESAGAGNVIIVKALDDISLELRDGDRVGIVGHNGAGKTTLLRVLAGIYPPTSGTAIVSGRVSALTDLMMGMDLEASGYDNIFLRGIVMGLDYRAAKAIRDDVAEFTELGEYLNLPIRTYSSGMLLRLAFAVSTAVQPEIVILDEMISAGDASFLAKAQQRLESLIRKASILVLAAHDDMIIKAFCHRCIWMQDGKIATAGRTLDVLQARNVGP
jgi:ABC-type polysaccharide/polyol phosphate transport system ATPase subunit